MFNVEQEIAAYLRQTMPGTIIRTSADNTEERQPLQIVVEASALEEVVPERAWRSTVQAMVDSAMEKDRDASDTAQLTDRLFEALCALRTTDLTKEGYAFDYIELTTGTFSVAGENIDNAFTLNIYVQKNL